MERVGYRSLRTRTLVAALAVALSLGVGVGFAIGFSVEHDRANANEAAARCVDATERHAAAFQLLAPPAQPRTSGSAPRLVDRDKAQEQLTAAQEDFRRYC